VLSLRYSSGHVRPTSFTPEARYSLLTVGYLQLAVLRGRLPSRRLLVLQVGWRVSAWSVWLARSPWVEPSAGISPVGIPAQYSLGFSRCLSFPLGGTQSRPLVTLQGRP